MKFKNVYSIIVVIFLIVGVALWKLNETYKADKTAIKQNQLQTQLTALRSSLVSQISQLRNTLSSYTLQIDESKINWIQLKPFYALALVQEDGSNRLAVSKLYLQSGSVADRWNAQTVEQNLAEKVSGNQLLRAQTFKDSSGLVHLALVVFEREKRSHQSRSGVMVIGDVSYFQRFFDLQRTSSVTQVLLTADKVVAAHSEYEYVGNLSSESKISEANFFVDRQEIRGTNLNLLSYTSKKAQSQLDIPMPIVGIIVGLGFLMAGILVLVAKPATEVTAVVPTVESAIQAVKPVVESKPYVRSVLPKVEAIPLIFDQESQIVPIQIQACVQQAMFNVDRQLKNSSVSISKEFISAETVTLDYPKFIKIFENVLLNISQGLVGQGKKKVYVRSYDSQDLTILEIQAPISGFNLHESILSELHKADGEFEQALSSAGEPVLRFTFTRPEVEATAAVVESVVELPKRAVAVPVVETRVSVTTSDDLDIDAILSLDDIESKVEKEMQPAKFKLDENMSIVEDPEIDVQIVSDEKVDQSKVKIRRPEKG